MRNAITASLLDFLPTTQGFPPPEPDHSGTVTWIAIYFVLIFVAMGAINAATGSA